MIDEYGLEILPEQSQPVPPPPPATLIERHGISPVLFALLVLIVIFFLYQVVGGLATALIFGFSPTAANVNGFRIATGVGEILFILIPTLILTRCVSFKPKDFLRLRVPDFRMLLVPLVGIFSLQQLLQLYLFFQDKIPMPQPLEGPIHQFKEMLEEAYKLLVNAHSVPELIFVGAVVALIPAFAEEFLFRGLIQRSLEKGLTPMKGAVLTGIIFGAYHLNPFSIVPLIILGIYLGFLALRANSIWVSVTTHFYNNAIACVAAYLSRDDTLVTGDPEQMSARVLLFTFVSCALVFVLSTYYFIAITKKINPIEHSEKVLV